jgi:predicted CoA-binding protein
VEYVMVNMPAPVAEFLRGKRIAVAGVSREPRHAANVIYRKLRDCRYEAFPINPNASEVEGVRCYPDLGSVPGPIDGIVVATRPDVAIELVRQSSERGVRRIWFHRSFGQGSVADAAVRECQALGLQCIVGGCPLMYCEPVDFGHRCMRWWLRWLGRVPG